MREIPGRSLLVRASRSTPNLRRRWAPGRPSYPCIPEALPLYSSLPIALGGCLGEGSPGFSSNRPDGPAGPGRLSNAVDASTVTAEANFRLLIGLR
jgi:hypothetical protein